MRFRDAIRSICVLALLSSSALGQAPAQPDCRFQSSAAEICTGSHADGGFKYFGEYRHGTMHGQGIGVWRSGARYVGEWVSGKATGLGYETFSDGTSYIGQFSRNKFHGLGIFYTKNGIPKQVGRWAMDRFSGSEQVPGQIIREVQARFISVGDNNRAFIRSLRQDASGRPPQLSSTQSSSLVISSTKRVALLIGNSRYRHRAGLENPGNDTELLARVLRSVGFSDVVVKQDLTVDDMRRAVRDFGVIADASDFALIYYAGHAIQIGGANYLIPVDARLHSDRDVEFETIASSSMLTALSGSKKLKVLILDACRDNPFEQQMRRTIASRSIGRGLSKMEPATTGELIVFAAAAGEVAADGQGANSPFATALAARIQNNPPIEIRRLFDYVRDDVLSLTRSKQRPFTYGSLSAREDFFFSR